MPLHPAVVERLLDWLNTKKGVGPDDTLFGLRTTGGHWRKTAKMMQTDLAAARSLWLKEAQTESELDARRKSDFLTYKDEDGLFADFHANRHTFVSNLGKAGVNLTTAQKLARHHDPKLTANIYTHLEVTDLAVAVAFLPAPPVAFSQPIAAATGTDGVGADPVRGQKRGQYDREKPHQPANPGERQYDSQSDDATSQVDENTGLSYKRREAAIIHPSGSEPSTKSPANSLGKRKKGPSVAPLVAPSASDLTPLHAIELIERFYQLDDSGRAGLLKFARELGRKSKCK